MVQQPVHCSPTARARLQSHAEPTNLSSSPPPILYHSSHSFPNLSPVLFFAPTQVLFAEYGSDRAPEALHILPVLRVATVIIVNTYLDPDPYHYLQQWFSFVPYISSQMDEKGFRQFGELMVVIRDWSDGVGMPQEDYTSMVLLARLLAGRLDFNNLSSLPRLGVAWIFLLLVYNLLDPFSCLSHICECAYKLQSHVAPIHLHFLETDNDSSIFRCGTMSRCRTSRIVTKNGAT